jgi:hypothetical protein
MNALQMSKDGKYVYIAREHQIYCFERTGDDIATSAPHSILVPVRKAHQSM